MAAHAGLLGSTRISLRKQGPPGSMSREQRPRRERRQPRAINQLPWRNYRNPYSPIQAVTADQLEAIHNASLRILEELGIEFLDDEARVILKQHGAEVQADGNRVRMPRELVLQHVAKAPREFTLHARNPEHNLTFGANHINFGSVASAPNVSD